MPNAYALFLDSNTIKDVWWQITMNPRYRPVECHLSYNIHGRTIKASIKEIMSPLISYRRIYTFMFTVSSETTIFFSQL